MQKITLPEAFRDARGVIQNLLEQSCGGVSIIYTRAGSYRSDHMHKTDGHWLFVISGQMHYTECPAGDVDGPSYPPYELVDENEMVYTGPLIFHKTFFPVDTVLISMSLRPRDKASHEEDVVRR